MKLLERIQSLKTWAMLLFAAGTLASCNILDEEEQDCAVYVSFKYDMNMKFADAFANSVKSVTLYAFDKNGKLAFQKTEEGSMLAQEGYAMRLDEISRGEQDEYDFITWAGLANNPSFSVPLLQVGTSTKEDLICQLKRAEGGVVSDDLEALFHGQKTGMSFSRAGSEKVTIPLTKNTNNIRIVLQHLSGKPVEVEKFHFTITDKNGLMNYDNSLLLDEVLTYQAWRKDQGSASLGDPSLGTEDGTTLNVAIAELTVGRLMADMEPVLTVTNDEGEKVLSIPLVDYALMVKGHYNRNMSDQEYLDRQDEYNMTFFLDERGYWLNSRILINGWAIVRNEIGL